MKHARELNFILLKLVPLLLIVNIKNVFLNVMLMKSLWHEVDCLLHPYILKIESFVAICALSRILL